MSDTVSRRSSGGNEKTSEWLDVKWVLDPIDRDGLHNLTLAGGDDTRKSLEELDSLWHGQPIGYEECKKAVSGVSRYVLRKTIPLQEVYDVGKQLGKPGTYGSVREVIPRNDK